MANVRTLKLGLLADVSNFTSNLDVAQKKTKSFSEKLESASRKAAVGFAGVAAASVAFAKAAAEDQNAAVQLAGQLKATTGATNAQVAAVEDYITKTSMAVGVSDDQLRPALSRLVRSTKDVGEAQKLMNLALDISARTGKPAETVALALAKANDGQYTALKKLGITMGDQTQNAADLVSANKKLIKEQDNLLDVQSQYGINSKEYVKAQEKVAAAQADVNTISAEGVDWVGELSKEFGGAATDKANTAAGSFERLKVTMDETKEAIGVGLLPMVQGLANLLTPLASQVQKNSKVFSVLMTIFLAFTGTVMALNYGLKAYLAITKAYTTVTKIATAVQLAWNVAMTANPIGLVVVAIGLLVAGFVLAYKKIKPFRDLINSIWESMKKLIDAMKNSAIGKAVTSAFNKITGSKAVGGSVKAGQAYNVGEMGREVFVPSTGGQIIPTNKLGGGGNTFIFNGVVDGESARRSIEKLMQNSSRRTGAVNFVGGSL